MLLADCNCGGRLDPGLVWNVECGKPNRSGSESQYNVELFEVSCRRRSALNIGYM